MFEKKNRPVMKMGFVQASGVALYCGLVGSILWNGEKIFGPIKSFAGPITFLLLFSFSVLICGLAVFYKPYQLFFDGKKKEAADLVLYTTGWLFVYFLVILSLALFLR